MRILSLESSAKSASSAVLEDGKLLKEHFVLNDKTHSETLLIGADKILKELNLSFKDIDLFAVTNGPGSFTGLRIALSAIKGLAFPDTKTLGLSTLEVIAEEFREEKKPIVVCALMDARAGQFYNALFLCGNGEIKRLCEDRALKAEEIYEELKNYKNVIAAGDGAALFCEKYKDIKNSGKIQTAKNVARLAFLNKEKAVHPRLLSCNYLRLSQAERERLKKQSK